MRERLGVAGSGAIACGLAATAARHGEVLLWARSSTSAERARGTVDKVCGRLSGEINAGHVRIVEELGALSEATVVVEAIAEDLAAKTALFDALAGAVSSDALLASTTSSLSIEQLATASGRPERFFGLHVFNPVPQMKLVELIFPEAAGEDVRERALALSEDLGKTAVVVPDTPGFVVNRLLFPYLFSAVELMQETGLDAEAVDAAMKLGAGHPMGPIALLDYVGLDVAMAIGDEIGAAVPPRIRDLVAEGATGKKAGRGLYDYEPAAKV